MERTRIKCLDARYSTTRRVIESEAVLCVASKANALLRESRHSHCGGLRTIGYQKADSVREGADDAAPRPLISIITVTFNAVELLEQTLLSVLDQTYDNVEYIVVDGNSTDGTREIIRKYEHAIDYWISEPDSGIYEAMNKGISLASGYYVAMLNASDWYSPDLLKTVAEAHVNAAGNPRTILYTHFHLYLDDLQHAEKRWCAAEPQKGMSISHQAMFVGAAIYKEIGDYSLQYRLSADYDFLIRAHRGGYRFVQVETHGVYFRAGGRSAADKSSSIREAARALRGAYGLLSFHHARFVLVEWLGFFYFRCFRNLLIRLAGKQNVTAMRKLRRGIFRK